MKHIKLLGINIFFIALSIFTIEFAYKKIYNISNIIPGSPGKIKINYDRKSINAVPRFVEFSPSDNKNNLTHIFKKKNKQNNCNVLIIGGSTTEERTLHVSEKWTYNYFLEINNGFLPPRCKEGIKVINAGVSGHSTWGNYADLKFWLKKELKKADLVIIYQGINDNHQGFSSEIHKLLNSFIGESLSSKIRYYHIVLKSWFSYNSIIYSVLKDLLKQKKIETDVEVLKNKDTQYIKLKKPERFYFGNLNKIYLDNTLFSDVDKLPGYKDYISISNKIYNKIITSGSNLIVITQTYPSCDIRENNLIKYKEIIPNKKSKNSKIILDYVKKDLISDNLGLCLRVKLNSRAQKIAFERLTQKQKNMAKFIDYSSYKKIHLEEIGNDNYHKDPKSAKILFQDFKNLGLIKLSKELLLKKI